MIVDNPAALNGLINFAQSIVWEVMALWFAFCFAEINARVRTNGTLASTCYRTDLFGPLLHVLSTCKRRYTMSPLQLRRLEIVTRDTLAVLVVVIIEPLRGGPDCASNALSRISK